MIFQEFKNLAQISQTDNSWDICLDLIPSEELTKLWVLFRGNKSLTFIETCDYITLTPSSIHFNEIPENVEEYILNQCWEIFENSPVSDVSNIYILYDDNSFSVKDENFVMYEFAICVIES